MSTTMTLSDIPFTAVQTDDDAALLRRYARGREQAAFNRLVDRHGPMVLGVCQRLLGEGAEADQAFQDAFLALARRANALNVPVSGLGPWLYFIPPQQCAHLRDKKSRSCLLRDGMWHGRPAHDCIFTRASCPCHREFIPKQTRAGKSDTFHLEIWRSDTDCVKNAGMENAACLL